MPLINKEPITSEEALSLIKKAVAAGEKEVNFTGKIFSDFDLRFTDIPVSLNCEGAIFENTLNLCNSNFGGHFINLEKATLKNGIALNSLKAKRGGYSIYLRDAIIVGEIQMKNTTLHWLAIGGATYLSKDKNPINPVIHLDGTNILMGLSLSSHN